MRQRKNMEQIKKKKKSYKVGIYFNTAEQEQLRAKADKLGVSFGKFVKNCAIENDIIIRRRTTKKTDPKLLYEINKIGCNINQIAHQLNKMQELERAHPQFKNNILSNIHIVIADLKSELIRVAKEAKRK